MEKQLFKAQTIPQFKIHQWLLESGLDPEAIVGVEYPAYNSVKIEDHNGDSLTLTVKNGEVKEEYHIKEEV